MHGGTDTILADPGRLVSPGGPDRSEGLTGYQAAISSTYRWMDMAPSRDADDCSWNIVHNDLGLVRFSQIECEGAFATAIRSDADEAAGRRIVILSVEEGVFEQQAGNRHIRCEPGTLALMNVGRRMEGAQDGRVKLYSAVFPTQLLATHCPDVEQFCCLKVPADKGLAKVLRDLVQSATMQPGAMSGEEVRSLSLAISELIDGVFSASQSTVEPPYLKHYRDVIGTIIQEYLSDMELCPQMIADKLGISRSYLFSLARKCDFSIERTIVEQRLDRCAETLKDRRWDGRNISEIAYRWGFKDLSHFSRSFSSRFGVSPRGYRKGGN